MLAQNHQKEIVDELTKHQLTLEHQTRKPAILQQTTAKQFS
jgi:hypothetical protein